MSVHPYAYFSKMFQAVPQLMEVQKHAGGTFVTTRASTYAAVRRLYPDVPVEKYGTWFPKLSGGYKALSQAKAIVTGSPNQALLEKFHAKSCMVFHGTYMFLSEAALRRMTHFDLLCSIGPRMRRTIERCRENIELNAVETGYLPFGSFPDRTEENSGRSLASLGLQPGHQTIVYMPWGKPYGSWEVMAEKIVRGTPPEFNLILRPHPSQGLTSRRRDRQSFRRVSTLCEERRHTFLDLNTLPLPQLFALADLMITDGTSPAEESLFYDVPQLFIETPLWSRDVIRQYAQREKMHDDDLEAYFGLFECGPTYHAQHDAAISAAMENALSLAGTLQGRRMEYFSWVFGQRDRLAGERVKDALQGLIYDGVS